MKNIVIGLSIAVIFGGGALFGMSALTLNMNEKTMVEDTQNQLENISNIKKIEASNEQSDNNKLDKEDSNKNNKEQNSKDNSEQSYNKEVNSANNSEANLSKPVITLGSPKLKSNDKYYKEDEDDEDKDDENDKDDDENDKYDNDDND